MKLLSYKSFQYKKDYSIYCSLETQFSWTSFGEPVGRCESA